MFAIRASIASKRNSDAGFLVNEEKLERIYCKHCHDEPPDPPAVCPFDVMGLPRPVSCNMKGSHEHGS
jgi:hypothetical protein